LSDYISDSDDLALVDAGPQRAEHVQVESRMPSSSVATTAVPVAGVQRSILSFAVKKRENPEEYADIMTTNRELDGDRRSAAHEVKRQKAIEKKLTKTDKATARQQKHRATKKALSGPAKPKRTSINLPLRNVPAIGMTRTSICCN
jgi:hypothetical protein